MVSTRSRPTHLLLLEDYSHLAWCSHADRHIHIIPDKKDNLIVLLPSSCYDKVPSTGWLIQQTTISHTSGDLRVQDQGSGRFGVWSRPSFGLQTADFSLCTHVAEGRRQPSEVSFIRALTLFMSSPPS